MAVSPPSQGNRIDWEKRDVSDDELLGLLEQANNGGWTIEYIIRSGKHFGHMRWTILGWKEVPDA